jgi:hypothetical protein
MKIPVFENSLVKSLYQRVYYYDFFYIFSEVRHSKSLWPNDRQRTKIGNCLNKTLHLSKLETLRYIWILDLPLHVFTKHGDVEERWRCMVTFPSDQALRFNDSGYFWDSSIIFLN